jgi:hypothetical protein
MSLNLQVLKQRSGKIYLGQTLKSFNGFDVFSTAPITRDSQHVKQIKSKHENYDLKLKTVNMVFHEKVRVGMEVGEALHCASCA